MKTPARDYKLLTWQPWVVPRHLCSAKSNKSIINSDICHSGCYIRTEITSILIVMCRDAKPETSLNSHFTTSFRQSFWYLSQTGFGNCNFFSSSDSNTVCTDNIWWPVNLRNDVWHDIVSLGSIQHWSNVKSFILSTGNRHFKKCWHMEKIMHVYYSVSHARSVIKFSRNDTCV